MLISVLISLTIMMLLLTGIPTLGELLFLAVILVPIGVAVVFLRNHMADGLVSMFLGGGTPATSAAELQTDVADGYAQQQEYDAAVYAYEQALRTARGPQRAPLMLRIAETAMLAQRPEEALRWWNEGLKQKKGLTPEQRAGALFRMAEVLRESLHDIPGAARLLKRVLDEYPGSKYATFAADRIRDLAREQAAP